MLNMHDAVMTKDVVDSLSVMEVKELLSGIAERSWPSNYPAVSEQRKALLECLDYMREEFAKYDARLEAVEAA
ncbi:MAG: hypothetical protein AAF661_05845 [Pseudomonadota bacterium]